MWERPGALDYALAALFLSLLACRLRSRINVTVALAAGLLAVAFAPYAPYGLLRALGELPGLLSKSAVERSDL